MTRSARARHLMVALAASAALTTGWLSPASLTGSAAAAPPAPSAVGGNRVTQLIAQMTLDEKLTMLEGQSVASAPSPANQSQAGYLPGIPRLNIPSLTLADGPPGVVTREDSTGMVSTMGLAATFSRERSKADGVVIGKDAEALGQDVVLEPFINMNRDTSGSRTWNTSGEDPFLTGQLGASQIRGIQSTGTMAMAKHYVGYDGAEGNNVQIDEQTLHEVYVAPFEDAVKAGVSSIMCAYNAINLAIDDDPESDYSSCGSSYILTKILREELGFKGFVTSDWFGTHATDYINAGLDMEMPGTPGPGPNFFSRERMAAAVADGTVTEGRIDQAVGRILFMYDRFGLLDVAPKHSVTDQDREQNNNVIQTTANQAATLLKNDAGALPLSGRKSLALVGPGAGQNIATFGTGEKSGGVVAEQTGTYQVLRNKLGPKARLSYAVGDDMTGRPVPASVLSHDGQPGLTRTGTSTATDGQLWFTTRRGNPLPAGSSNTWAGTLTAPETGSYWLNMGILGGAGTLTVDGNRVGGGSPRYGRLHANEGNSALPATDGVANFRFKVQLTAGEHSIGLAQTPDSSNQPVQVRLSWVTPTQQQADHDEAVEAAKNASTAVVFAWNAPEGDLSAPLPEDQDQLISDIAAVNPNTVVVLNTSQPVAMPWLSEVKSVLQMWYSGDRGGYATADTLLGQVNPGGKLPFTWPQSIEQEVAHDPAHPERSSDGVGAPCPPGAGTILAPWTCPLTTYSEGVNIGYRHFEATNQTPLYPFGFGLSYTKFKYQGLQVERSGDGGLDVRVSVTNTGNRAGDTVPQIYLGAPSTAPGGVQFAKSALAGFTRITVGPKRTKTVRIHVRPRQLQYWSSEDDRWVTATGTRQVSVRTDARQVSMARSITVS